MNDTIKATRIVPPADTAGQHKRCPRCGQDFPDRDYRWAKGAPCRDCRDYYVKHEGHEYDEWRTEHGKQQAEAHRVRDRARRAEKATTAA